MTTPTYRSPLRLITANGTPLPKVFAHRVSRGWDQALATAEITIPWPPPAQVGKWSQIVVRDGVSALFGAFVGYVTGMNNTLWPGTMALQCEDRLALAKYYKPSSNHDLSNKTDQAAVSYILTQVGIPYSAALIGGTGKKIGSATSQALTWTRRETALAKIQQIDQVSARDHGGGNLTMYRTFADAGGAIRRVELANVPGLTAARTFTEGIDLEAGSAVIENVEPKTIVTVAGDHGILTTVTDGGANTWAVVSNPDAYLYPMLQQAITDGTFLGTDLPAANLLQRFNLNLIRLNFTTWREDLIGAIETDRFDSDHCMVTLNAFVQSVVRGGDESGGFTQQVSLVSAREFNINPKAVKNFNPFTGAPLLPPPDLLPPPTPDSVQAAFTVLAIDVELVLIADVETLIYTAVCEDASTSSGGTIVTRAWTTTGSPIPASGSGVNFNPSWTSLAGATVTLTVTDSLGAIDIVTHTISQTMGAPVRSRDLFAAAGDALEAFSGADRTWRTYRTGIVACGVVANGPLWADGATVYRSDDFLASPPSNSIPLAGEDVTCLWTELDLDENAVVAGLTNGYVAFSSDAGATWVVKVGPDPPNPPIKVILSRFQPGEVHAITATGYYQSADAGDNWGLIRAGDYRDLDLNLFRNWAIATGTASTATLLFEDTFSYEGPPDPSRWVPAFWYGDSLGSSTKSSITQSFHARRNVYVSGGYLHLRAVHENIYGCGGDPCATYPYSSAVISTGRDGTNTGPAKFEFGQGYAEARIKFPSGSGMWSGLVVSEQYTSAVTGIPFEIDVVECLGVAPTHANLSIHDNPSGHSTVAYTGPDFTADFHTFGIERLPGELVWYIDGVERRRVSDVDALKTAYLFMDIQVGTSAGWAGAPDGSTVFPCETLIDYVRVWSAKP